MYCLIQITKWLYYESSQSHRSHVFNEHHFIPQTWNTHHTTPNDIMHATNIMWLDSLSLTTHVLIKLEPHITIFSPVRSPRVPHYPVWNRTYHRQIARLTPAIHLPLAYIPVKSYPTICTAWSTYTEELSQWCWIIPPVLIHKKWRWVSKANICIVYHHSPARHEHWLTQWVESVPLTNTA